MHRAAAIGLVLGGLAAALAVVLWDRLGDRRLAEPATAAAATEAAVGRSTSRATV